MEIVAKKHYKHKPNDEVFGWQTKTMLIFGELL